jgi:hypothetical protein
MPAPPPAPELTRQRIDYRDRPDGSVEAILTISLPGGTTKRFTSVVTRKELEAVEGEIVGAELALAGPDAVGFSFGKLIKGVSKVAKSVASSKVFKLASSGLALAAPLLGPIAPVALAAAAGMGVASKLSGAAAAAAKGASAVANALTQSAANDAKRLTKTPQGAASLLAAANAKRLGAERIAAKSAPKPPPPKPKPKAAAPKPKPKAAPKPPAPPAPPPPPAPRALPAPAVIMRSEADLLARARQGRVRSNVNQPVSDSQLLAAHRSGRVYWVQ